MGGEITVIDNGWRSQIAVYASDGIPCADLPPLPVLKTLEAELETSISEPRMGRIKSGQAVVELQQTFKIPGPKTITSS
jgi:hypothetical protein